MAAGGVGYFLMAPSEPVVEAYAPSVAPPLAPPSSMPFSPSSSVTLRINVEPAGAQVLVDGSVVGTSPLVVQRPRSETPLRIEARMPGYHSAQQTIVPQNDTVLALTLARDDSLRGGGSPSAPVAQTTDAPTANSGANASAANPEVRGSLPPEVIQRVIRRHLSTLRGCYERQLIQNPSLSGRVSIRFVIGADGRVASASVSSSSANNPTMENCLVQATQQMRFPPPEGGGVVIVTYPFVFASAE